MRPQTSVQSGRRVSILSLPILASASSTFHHPPLVTALQLWYEGCQRDGSFFRAQRSAIFSTLYAMNMFGTSSCRDPSYCFLLGGSGVRMSRLCDCSSSGESDVRVLWSVLGG